MTYDNVNRPAHYAKGRRFEVIEVIEDWAQFAPTVKQGITYAQVLKYLGRLWGKGDPMENLSKALWYLERLEQHLIDHEEPAEGPAPGGNIDLELSDDTLDFGGFGEQLSSTGDILRFDLS